jgi:hypothetical protein
LIYDECNFYDLLDKFAEVGVIENLDFDDFRKAFHSEESKKYNNIVYVWRSISKVPRLKGVSNILYIGKTVKTLAGRYTEFELENTEVKTQNNRLKYDYILKNYGGKIILSVLSVNNIDFKIPDNVSKRDKLLFIEGQLLRWYFLNHCEYPPLNYTKTTVKNKELGINFKS